MTSSGGPARPERAQPEQGGLVIVDKPGGLTSHDVVARIRRIAGTRRVGHAGTLDPMATGVLVVGVEKATRILGYLTLTEKEYQATIRLGQSTSTDDAEGEVVSASPRRVEPAEIQAAIEPLTGTIAQVPPQVSAIKVNGQRAYKLTRAGAAPELAARPVTVYSFTVDAVREVGGFTDVDATIRCSSGTYIRSLARDLGAALGTGGHLTVLRRTRVGPYSVAQAQTLDFLSEHYLVLPLAAAASQAFQRRDLTAPEATLLAHGARLPLSSPPASSLPAGPRPLTPSPPAASSPIAAFAPDGTLVALIEEDHSHARPLVVFA